MRRQLAALDDYAAKARKAYDLPQSDGVEASGKAWQELFGAKFCKPPAAKALPEASFSFRAADGEQDIEADLGFPISPGTNYQVVVRGRVSKKSDRLFGYDLAKHGNRVRKHRSLAFEITRCTVPKPYDTYWKVRNDGEEATRLNVLRGQIELGNAHRSEITAYRGNHYVEIYIVKDRRCVAIDRQRVRSTSADVPLMNDARGPRAVRSCVASHSSTSLGGQQGPRVISLSFAFHFAVAGRFISVTSHSQPCTMHYADSLVMPTRVRSSCVKDRENSPVATMGISHLVGGR
ncbi:MAG TPA: hypothetical protein VF225_02710 [Gaiellaceae bacterium]